MSAAMLNTARGVSLKILERCRRDQAFSDSLVTSVLADSGLSSRDRALVTRLCYGVISNTILLDFYISAFCDNEKKLEPKVRDILRLSLYQLLFLSRVPDHAAVSEAVELCKAAGLSRASGLVNAVLRRAIRSRESLPEIPGENRDEYLSIRYSVPIELTRLLLEEFGEETAEALFKANSEIPPLTICVNTLKTSAAELKKLLEARGLLCEPHEFMPDALNLLQAGDISALPEFRNGLFFVQDAAAMLAVNAADLAPGQRVLDVCAAPGGKSFSAAMRMNNDGELISCDLHEKKLARVSKGAETLGLGIIKTLRADATIFEEDFNEAFDTVIADVPCSGLGVIRKKPDIRYKDVDALSALPKLQLQILCNVSSYVKPGGVLLYSTCTILRRENIDVVDAFLDKNSEFSLEAFELPELGERVPNGAINLYPHIHNTDGFFICRMRRASDAGAANED